MRIAVVGTLWIKTPPGKYGGTEEVVYNLVNELTARGHAVTFFGPANAKVNARIISHIDKPIREMGLGWNDDQNINYHSMNLTAAFDRQNEFDVIHMHLNKDHDFMSLPLSLQSTIPWLFTCHFLLPSETDRKDRYDLLAKYKALPFTSISDSQRAGSDLNFVATVHNSLAIDKFPFSAETDEYYAWIGRVKRDKGTKEALLAAKKAGIKLYLMGAIDEGDPEMFRYYKEEVKPLIDGKQLIWLGEADLKTKVKYLSRAKAMLNPIHWREPFGLVMVESQAVGTPVISFNRGAAPELVQDGKTGFLVNNVSEMVRRIPQVKKLDREDCRRNVEEHFSISRMVTGYEKAYEKVIKRWPEYVKQQHSLIKTTVKQENKATS